MRMTQEIVESNLRNLFLIFIDFSSHEIGSFMDFYWALVTWTSKIVDDNEILANVICVIWRIVKSRKKNWCLSQFDLTRLIVFRLVTFAMS